MKPQHNNQSPAPNYSSQGASEAAAPISSPCGAAALINLSIEAMKERIKKLPYNCHEAIKLRALIHVKRTIQLHQELHGKPRVRVKAVMR